MIVIVTCLLSAVHDAVIVTCLLSAVHDAVIVTCLLSAVHDAGGCGDVLPARGHHRYVLHRYHHRHLDQGTDLQGHLR